MFPPFCYPRAKEGVSADENTFSLMSNEEGETKSEWLPIFITKKNCHEPRQTARREIDQLFMTLDFSVIFILD